MIKFKSTMRIAAIILNILLIFILLPGCNSGDSGSKNSGMEIDPVSSETPYKIRWYTIGTPQKDIPIVMDVLSKYTLKKINAYIEMIQYDWGEYNDKMALIIQSGEPYDICFTCNGANDFFGNATKGAFLPLDDLLQKFGQGILKEEHPLFLEAAKINGKTYAIPVNKELNCKTVWAFNKRTLDKYGLSINNVKGIETLEPLLKKVKEGEGDNMPDVFVINANTGIPEAGLIDYPIGEDKCIGMRMDTKDFKFINKYEDPDVINTLRYLRKYYLAGYIRKDAAAYTGGEYQEPGNYLVKQDGWIPGADELWSRGVDYKIISTPVYDKLYISNGGLLGSAVAISVTSGNSEVTMKFLNLLNTDKYVRNTVDSGVEDIHYKMEKNRQVDLDKSKDYNMPTYSLGNRYILNSYKDDSTDDMGSLYRKMNETGIPSPLIGFRANTEGLITELTAIANINKEFGPGLTTGSVDPDVYLPKFIAKLKSVGFDKVKDEIQRQYDVFREKNSNK